MRNLISLLLFFSLTFLYSQQDLFLSPQKYNRAHYKTIREVFTPPSGFKRIHLEESSFGHYLRNLPVVDSVVVLTFKGATFKVANDTTVAGVIPVAIEGKSLWHCMDILQVLHMDYLESNNRKQEISYPLPEGTSLSWLEWQNGVRPVFKGLKFVKESRHPKLVSVYKIVQDSSVKNFRRYCNTIFEFSGTQTFWHNSPHIKLAEIQPGDFIVKKGDKGHAVLIVDLAINEKGEKVALIGQGDTPACQFYLLMKEHNPWFKIDENVGYPDLPIRKKMYWSGLRRF